jgi:hypothetical protein
MSTTSPLQKLATKPLPVSHSAHASLLLQRKCACGSPTSSLAGDCEDCKRKKLLQTKLAMGASNDPLEMEADRMADQLLSVPEYLPISRAQQRIQRYTTMPTGQMEIAPDSVDQVLTSPGTPLESTLRHDMEQRFGFDFSQVRVHTDKAAEQSVREVNANAYTVGHHIAFGRGHYLPGTVNGDRLLAHELTHVVQQDSNRASTATVQRKARGSAHLAQSAMATRRKIVRQTVYVDQNRTVYDFNDGSSEEHAVSSWNARDPIPGTYHFKETGTFDQWRPAPAWVRPRNFRDPTDNRIWVVDDPPQVQLNEERDIEIVGGEPGRELHSSRDASKLLSPEMKEVLMPEPGIRVHDISPLAINTPEDEYAWYRMMREVDRHKITATELYAYQKLHLATRQAKDFRELEASLYQFIEQTENERSTQLNSQSLYAATTADLEGDRKAYSDAVERARKFDLRIDFAYLARIYTASGESTRDSGETAKGRLFGRVDDWMRQFEKQAISIASQLLTNLELQLRMDLRYISGHNMPARQKAQWERMRGKLATAGKKIDPIYKGADEIERQIRQKQLNLLSAQIDIRSADRRERIKHLEGEIAELSQSEKSLRGWADSEIVATLPELRAARLFPDFPYRKVLTAADNTSELSSRVRRFLNDKIILVNAASIKLRENPEWIYQLDNLMSYVKRTLPKPIEEGSVYDAIIRDHAALVHKKDSWLDDLLTLISIALMFVPGGAIIALPIDIKLLGSLVGNFNRQKLAYQTNLSSVEPSEMDVYMSAAGVAGSVTSILPASRRLRTTEAASEAGSATEKEVATVRSTENLGEASKGLDRGAAAHGSELGSAGLHAEETVVDLSELPKARAEAREASVAQSSLVDEPTHQQLRNEIDEIANHPEWIEGKAPDRAVKMGKKHRWMESGPYMWCRHSPIVYCVRKPPNFETGPYKPYKGRVKTGTAPDLDNPEIATGRPHVRQVTAEEQKYGIPTKTEWERLRDATPPRNLATPVTKYPVVEGMPDPALPGLIVSGPAQMDHVVSVDRIRKMDGFAYLDREQQIEVLNIAENFVPLSPAANQSKGSKSFIEWLEHSTSGTVVDLKFRDDMIALEQEVEMIIRDRIDTLVREKMSGSQ